MMNENFSIKNTTRQKTPPNAGLSFVQIKEQVLGKKYNLSLVFIGDALSRKLNKEYRNKDKATNILSFPVSEEEGEIFINLKQAHKDASKFKKRYNKFVAYLFVHGVLHLKGFDHGDEMEKEEEKIMRKFFNN
ncbi:rRNA maturation RNase YbeY [Patescibacteria group bacterium]